MSIRDADNRVRMRRDTVPDCESIHRPHTYRGIRTGRDEDVVLQDNVVYKGAVIPQHSETSARAFRTQTVKHLFKLAYPFS